MRNLIYILIVFLTLGICSCGTRKVNKSESKSEVKTKDTTELLVNTGAQVKVEEKTTSEETNNTQWDYESGTLTPIDPEKPMMHTNSEGKTNTWTNANVNFGKGSGSSETKTNQSTVTKTESKDTTQVKANSGSQADIKQSNKNFDSDRKGAAVNIEFWIGVAIAGGILMWFLWFIFIRRKNTEYEK